MRAKRVAVVQRKGGVGKTTIAVSLAAEISRRGGDVALIDADPLRSACHWAELGGLTYPIQQITLHPGQPATRWVNAVSRVAGAYVVIDTPPVDDAVAASIALADVAIVPCLPSGLDLEATGRTLDVVRVIRARRSAPLPVILVPNRVDRRTLEGRQIVEELERFGEIIAPPIGSRYSFVRAFSSGISVAALDPGGSAAHELGVLCDLVESYLHQKPAVRRAEPSRAAVQPSHDHEAASAS